MIRLLLILLGASLSLCSTEAVDGFDVGPAGESGPLGAFSPPGHSGGPYEFGAAEAGTAPLGSQAYAGPLEAQQIPNGQDTSDVPSSEPAAAPVTHVDVVRASQMTDLAQRAQVLEQYLNRPIRNELRMLVFRMLVSTCRQSGDFDGAIFYGEEALKEYPSDGPILLELTSAHAEMADSDLRKGIDYAKRAKAALDVAAEAMGEAGAGRISIFVGSCLSDWGWMLFRQGNIAEAERMLMAATDKRKDPGVYNRLGRVLAGAGKLDDAKEAFAMALALSSGQDSVAAEGLSEMITRQGGDEADVAAVVREKREEIAERKREMLREQAKIEPKPAPPFNVTTLAGETVSLEDLRGSVIVLDFWATWCGPCRIELPVIQKVSEGLKNEKVFFLAASVDADTSKVRPFVKANNLKLHVAFAKSAGRDYGASSIPSLFLIDGTGMIRYVHIGYHPGLEEILPMQIRDLLQEL